MFSTVLIANRGEIAVRIARACRELGIRSVAVYSTPDRDSAVVRLADDAVHIGPASAKRSYLNAAAIIEAARRTGAEAIHPGYGFLSEDPDFAEICAANGIVFIGPSPQLMADLGDKALARSVFRASGLPILPGSDGTVDDAAAAPAAADGIGFPLIIKAVAGGGGRGMSVVRNRHNLVSSYQHTRALAQAIFGDSRVYFERLIDGARHIEVQVLCDQHGSAVHLGERDCSVQRRHQKLVEESPAPGLPAEMTARMGAAAVHAVRSMGFTGVGTLEFLVDDQGDFYFIEINSRLQVEHPVTEMVTGIDLVREQIRVAAGLPLTVSQGEIKRQGVAIECRVNAEDPSRDFGPAPGKISEFVPPGGPFTRVDTHAFQGMQMTSDYDSLLAKVITWGPDRPQALARMSRALWEFRVAGPGLRTTIGFLGEVMAHPLFVDAKHSTDLVMMMQAEREDVGARAAGPATGR